MKVKDDLVLLALGDDVLLIDPDSNCAHLLNETGSIILSLARQARTLDDLRLAVERKFPGVPSGEICEQLDQFVAELREKRLIQCEATE